MTSADGPASGSPTGREPRPALFLDRDGVINIDRGYVSRIEAFEWVDGAAETIAAFNQRNWWVFVVTNQSGIAQGLYTEQDMEDLHAWMQAELAQQNAHIDRIYHCPYHEEGTIPRYTRDSYDRKPRPGMLIQAMTDFPVDKQESFLIGDKQADIDAARAAGIAGFRFSGGDLAQFAKWALADLGASR